ncbi:ethylbenzene dehydrogenase-related protein [Vibrio coralliirubri]|uniref:ethylbenzene dehydrogenase-related protein n=1 Tax=Vibrio coralliirubri TaxID=1516159 RepID=UPI0006317D49|nr:ethylbenzene dehydrogenase-related protein [Vibrio coralliirubri]CDU14394.1 putative di-heme cytochrome c [Vibrio coralliirubri]
MTKFSIRNNVLLAALSGLSLSANAYNMSIYDTELDVDWSDIPVVEKTMFFPGKVTFDWINSPAHKGTLKKGFETKTCSSCHQGEEEGLGEMLVQDDRLGNFPDKKGSIPAEFQFAHDDEHLYVKGTWKTESPFPARLHDTLLFQEGKWTIIGGDRGKNPYTPIYEDRFSLMIDDGSVLQFREQGCWMSCHRGARDIGQATARDVQALDVVGAFGLDQKDIRKYLPESRTERYGVNWDKVKPQEEIDKLKAEGQFVDLMQWRSTRSAPTNSADDGYVFEYRLNDKGTTVFTWNFDKKTGLPKYMYDKSVTGFYALNKEDFNDLNKKIAMVEGVNVMPYDASKIEEGQYLQGRLNREGAGSAGDNNQVFSSWEDGKYTVIFKRKLNTGHPEDDKIMEIGGTYDMNIAIHDGETTTRFHYVAFPFTVGIGEGSEGSVIALPIK